MDANQHENDEPATKWHASTATGSASQKTSADHMAADVEGRSFGRFLLVSMLGSGGMGTVYRAVHVNLKKTVAVKVLPRELLSNEKARARFHREISAISALSHPNIVRFETAGEEDGVPYLVMEFVQGINFEHLVASLGPLPAPEACQMIGQAALGLHHAHQAGLVHRDTKPSNLILAATGTVKVLDLGLAFLRETPGEATGAEHTIGTAECLAPEQALDSHDVDARTDVYGLGCVLFKLLTGRAPFEDAKHVSPRSTIEAHLFELPPSIKELRVDVPDELADFVATMLAKVPSDRPESALRVAEVLAAHAEGCDTQQLLRRAEVCPIEPTDPTDTGTVEYLKSALTLTTSDAESPPARAKLCERETGRRAYFPVAVAFLLLATFGVTSWLARPRTASQPLSPEPLPNPKLVEWTTTVWPERTVLSRTFGFAEVDLTVRLDGDLTFKPGQDTPNDNTILQGGLTRPEQNLFLDLHWDSLANGASVTLEFTKPVTDVRFMLFDVDRPDKSQDQIVVRGWDRGSSVGPLLTGSPANELSSDGGVITGCHYVPSQGPESDLGNVLVRFDEQVDKIEILFRPEGPAQFSGSQGIGLHDVQFSMTKRFGPTYKLDWDEVDWCTADRNSIACDNVDVAVSVSGDIGSIVQGNGVSQHGNGLKWSVGGSKSPWESTQMLDFSSPVTDVTFDVSGIGAARVGQVDRWSVVGLLGGSPVAPTVDVKAGVTTANDETDIVLERVSITAPSEAAAPLAAVRFSQPVDRVMLSYSVAEHADQGKNQGDNRHELLVDNLRFTATDTIANRQGQVRVIVPATANIWRQGKIGDFRDLCDNPPSEWPVVPSALNFNPGDTISFDVRGSVRERPGRLSRDPSGGPTVWFPGNDELAGFAAPLGSLIGLFVGSTRPREETRSAGAVRAKEENDGQDQGPLLGKVFLIGDGRDDNDARRAFVVPSGAERLSLGVMDSNNWRDNVGSYLVQIATGTGTAEAIAIETPEPLDIVSLVDADRDVLSGDGDHENEAFSLKSGDGKPGILQIPAVVPRQYTLKANVQRTEGDGYFGIGLPSAQGRFMVVFDMQFDESRRSGILQRTNGKGSLFYAPQNGLRIANVPVDLEVQVRDEEVRVLHRGEPVCELACDPSQLSMSPIMDTYYPHVVSFHAQNGEFVLRDITLIPPTGTLKPIKFSDPSVMPGRATAEQLIWKGGVVRLSLDGVPSRILGHLEDLPSNCLIYGVHGRDTTKGAAIDDADIWRLAQESELCQLNLGKTLISDSGFANLDDTQAFAHLERASFASTSLGDESLKAIVPHLKNIKWLCLCSTKVTGESLPALASLKTLETLHLRNLAVDDSHLGFVPTLPHLKELLLEGTQVTDAAVADLRLRLPELRIVK